MNVNKNGQNTVKADDLTAKPCETKGLDAKTGKQGKNSRQPQEREGTATPSGAVLDIYLKLKAAFTGNRPARILKEKHGLTMAELARLEWLCGGTGYQLDRMGAVDESSIEYRCLQGLIAKMSRAGTQIGAEDVRAFLNSAEAQRALGWPYSNAQLSQDTALASGTA
jgi:hypothetical protein